MSRLLRLIVGSVLLLSGIATAESRDARVPSDPLGVTYLANEGFFLEAGDQRVLIDALFDDGIDGYPAVPVPVRRQLEAGQGPWSGVELVLATHHHGDHFDAGAVARFLRAQPNAHFVGPPQAVDKLLAVDTDANALRPRTRALLPEPGSVIKVEQAGITLQVLNLHHGDRDPPVENLGYIVTVGDTRVLHFGDTEATRDDFAPHIEDLRDADIALLPFWFLTSEWRLAFVRDELRPRCIVVAHLPTVDAPSSYFGRWKSHAKVVKGIRERFPDAWIPFRVGETMPASCGVKKSEERP